MPDTTSTVAALCTQAGMHEGDAIRVVLLSVAESAERAERASTQIAKEAAQRSGQAVAQEARSQFAKVAREVTLIRALAVAGLVVVTAAGTWFAARQVPMATPLGRLTAAQIEMCRINDCGLLLASCQGVPVQEGEACQITRPLLWTRLPAVPSGTR